MASGESLYRPPSALDVLRLPVVGRLLGHRRGRLLLQLPFLLAAAALVVDGLTGPQMAARNLATVAPWVHYRGLLIVALLLAGNLFCMGCPFTLPRTLARKLSLRGRRFPRVLRGKWLAIAGLFVMFFLYEWLDLWASPALTAWVVLFYFAASFVLEAFFTESAFCKYVCPLGTFNFVYSTLSPSQIAVRDLEVCRHCAGRECLNGSYAPAAELRIDSIPVLGATQERSVTRGPQGVPGCGTLLFPPQMRGNLDCTLCLDCARACPHDNIGLFVRTPGRELLRPGSWPARWDLTLLVIVLAFMGLTNAFGMVPPVYELQQGLVTLLGTDSLFIVLLLIFVAGNLLLPLLLTLLAAIVSRALAGAHRPLREVAAAFAPAFVPAGFGIWGAHYAFHLLLAPLSLLPVLQEFLGGVGDWERFGLSVAPEVIGLVQGLLLVGGFLWGMVIAQRAALRLYGRQAPFGLLPWALLLLGLLLAALYVFGLDMEMRGVELLLH